MTDGSSGRAASGGKKRKPGQPGHRQPAPRKRRPAQASATPAPAVRRSAPAPKPRSPWAMLGATQPGTARSRAKARPRRDRLKTIRYCVTIGAALSAVGVVGSIIGVVIALGNPDDLLIFDEKYSIPVEFLLGIVGFYVLVTAVDVTAVLMFRRGRNDEGIRVAMFGGLALFAVVVFGIIFMFGPQGFPLAIVVAISLPWLLGPLIAAVPVTAAAGYMALAQRKLHSPQY